MARIPVTQKPLDGIMEEEMEVEIVVVVVVVVVVIGRLEAMEEDTVVEIVMEAEEVGQMITKVVAVVRNVFGVI